LSKARVNRSKTTTCLRGIATPSSAFGPTGVRNRRRKPEIGMRATCTSRANGSTNTTSRLMAIPQNSDSGRDRHMEGKFDPERLMQLYKKAGAKYFCSMGVHHDGSDPVSLWHER